MERKTSSPGASQAGSQNQSLNQSQNQALAVSSHHGPSEHERTVRAELARIQGKGREFAALHHWYNRADDFLAVISAVLTAVTVSAIIIGGVETHNKEVLWASAAMSTLSGIITVIQRTYNFKGKAQSAMLSSKQYSDLVRLIRTTLIKNNMTTEDWRKLMEEIGIRLTIIDDYTLPLPVHHPEHGRTESELSLVVVHG